MCFSWRENKRGTCMSWFYVPTYDSMSTTMNKIEKYWSINKKERFGRLIARWLSIQGYRFETFAMLNGGNYRGNESKYIFVFNHY